MLFTKDHWNLRLYLSIRLMGLHCEEKQSGERAGQDQPSGHITGATNRIVDKLLLTSLATKRYIHEKNLGDNLHSHNKDILPLYCLLPWRFRGFFKM